MLCDRCVIQGIPSCDVLGKAMLPCVAEVACVPWLRTLVCLVLPQFSHLLLGQCLANDVGME